MKKININGLEMWTTDEFTKTDWLGTLFIILAGITAVVILSYVLGDINNYLTQIIK